MRKRGDWLLSRYFLPGTPALIRKRVAIGCSFFIQGLIFATWCARIPDIKVQLGLNEAQLGAVLLMLPLGQFLMMVPNGFLVKHFGSRAMLIVAGFIYPVILGILGFATHILFLGGALFVAGAVANLSNTAVNTQAVMLEHYYRRSIITLFHGMWSVAGLVAVGVTLLFGYFGVSATMHFIGVGIFTWLLLSFSAGALMRYERPLSAERSERPKGCLGGWQMTPYILWLGIASFGCMACEGAIYDWSGVYFRDVVGVNEAQQSFGYFGYLCTMVAGRFVADRIVNRIGVSKVLYGSGLCISGGLALSLLCAGSGSLPALVVAVLGFALVGCGTSAVVPMCCGLAGKCRTLPPSIAIAEISTIGFFGFLVAPPLIGYVAHLSSLRVSFAMMAVVGLLVILATWALRRDLNVRSAP